MTTKNINGREVVFIEVPADAHSFRRGIQKNAIRIYGTAASAITDVNKEGLCWTEVIPGKFKIIGLASSLSEEQWAGIVESEFDTWLNYEEDDELGSYYLLTAKESGLSLLSSLGMKPGTTLLLIKEK